MGCRPLAMVSLISGRQRGQQHRDRQPRHNSDPHSMEGPFRRNHRSDGVELSCPERLFRLGGGRKPMPQKGVTVIEQRKNFIRDYRLG